MTMLRARRARHIRRPAMANARKLGRRAPIATKMTELQLRTSRRPIHHDLARGLLF